MYSVFTRTRRWRRNKVTSFRIKGPGCRLVICYETASGSPVP